MVLFSATTNYPFSSNTFSFFFNPSLLIPQSPFLTLILFSLPYLTLLDLAQKVFLEGGSPEVGQEDGVGATLTIPPESLIPKFLTLTLCLSAALPFLPQMLLGLVIPDIFVLMILQIFLLGPGLSIILLRGPLLILFSSQTFPSLKSFPHWLLSMNLLNMSEICSPKSILPTSYQVVTINLLFLFTSRSKCFSCLLFFI